MRKGLLTPLFSAAVLFSTTCLQAQHDRFAYAITDLSKDGSGWNALRKLDLQTGKYSDVLLNGIDQHSTVYDAATKKQLSLPLDARLGMLVQAPFSTGVAAAAYDIRHNRLYFTPMFVDQLRYIDLKTMKVYFVTDQPFTKLGNTNNDEGKIITRMVIAPDGYGYAISNDGNIFIRFSTGKKVRIEQLGALVDDPSNQHISIHNRCSSFGGDMISDDDGNLFILAAPNNIFKVNTQTRIATHLGSITNLPAHFTVNGAVVDANGKLLVSSAVDARSYYVVEPGTWTASPYLSADGIFRSSDLANSNYLCTKPSERAPQVIQPKEKYARLISIFPNPVTTNNVTMQFNKLPAGEYTIELTDVLGRQVMQRKIIINAEQQTQSLSLNSNNTKGTYMIKVIDRDKLSVFTQKVLVQ
jgi:hypothetical protein